MAYKLLGDKVVNPTDDDFGGATLVYILADSTTEVILEKSDGSTLIGKMKIVSGGTISLVKDATDKVTCANSTCTPISNHW